VSGAEEALTLLDALELDDYQPFHATRAELLRRAGRRADADAAYEAALALTRNAPERRFLEERRAALPDGAAER
jgi:RNA polymerase sigma-70 factor (ECF subfamily)